MTLTPEQIAQGWKLHDGSWGCPIKDNQTVHQVRDCSGWESSPDHVRASKWVWSRITAYRIIEAHGADAEPARPTPFPASYDDLVFDPITGWSQTVVVDGKPPEWLRDDDTYISWDRDDPASWESVRRMNGLPLAIRVRRREPKRETVYGALLSLLNGVDLTVSFDLIDGKPDLSTLKIAEDAL